MELNGYRGGLQQTRLDDWRLTLWAAHLQVDSHAKVG